MGFVRACSACGGTLRSPSAGDSYVTCVPGGTSIATALRPRSQRLSTSSWPTVGSVSSQAASKTFASIGRERSSLGCHAAGTKGAPCRSNASSIARGRLETSQDVDRHCCATCSLAATRDPMHANSAWMSTSTADFSTATATLRVVCWLSDRLAAAHSGKSRPCRTSGYKPLKLPAISGGTFDPTMTPCVHPPCPCGCRLTHRFAATPRYHFKKALVPRRGLEPPPLSRLVPETSASTNSATRARGSQIGRSRRLCQCGGARSSRSWHGRRRF